MLFRGTVYQAGYIVLTSYLDGRITDIVRGTHFLTTNQRVYTHTREVYPGCNLNRELDIKSARCYRVCRSKLPYTVDTDGVVVQSHVRYSVAVGG